MKPFIPRERAIRMPSRPTLRFLFLSLALIPALLARDAGEIAGPSSGAVFDEQTGAIRPIVGVPGSAYLGAPLIAGFEKASVAPSGKLALGWREGALFSILDLGAASPRLIPTEVPLARADRMVWNASSTAAAVYSASDRSLAILRDLGSDSFTAETLEISSLSGDIISLLLSSSAKTAIAGTADGVYLIESGSDARRLMTVANPAAIAFGKDDQTLYVGERDTGQIWEIAGLSGDAGPVLFADQRAGLMSVVGIQVSAAKNSLIAAGRESRTLVVFNLTTREVTASVELDFTPTCLSPSGADSAWVLNSLAQTSEPLFMVDVRDRPSVVFVPVGREQ